MLRAVAVQEARTEVHIRIDPRLARQRDLPADAQGSALIVIDIEESFRRRRKISQPAAGDWWAGVGRLGLIAVPRTSPRVFTDAGGLPSTKVMGMLPDQPAPL